VLVAFNADAHLTLFHLAHLENELSDLLGVHVDMVERETVKQDLPTLQAQLEEILGEIDSTAP